MRTASARRCSPAYAGLVRRSLPLFAGMLLALLLLAACRRDVPEPGLPGPVTIRTPKATFTPTPVTAPLAGPTPLAVAPGAGIGDGTAAPGMPVAAPQAGPQDVNAAKAVVNAPLVNLRRGPGTDFDILAEVARGAEFRIIGRNADGTWWQVCCVDDVAAWIIVDYVDTLGDVDAVPVVGPGTSLEPAQTNGVEQGATAAPAADSIQPATAETPRPAFDLIAQEQFPETALVRVFLYVYAEDAALQGYSLRITRDGQEQQVSGISFAGQPAFTWPFQDARQRYQNFKVEFPDVPAAGVWVIQLIDETGATVGPSATFTLQTNDPQQELYVRYQRR